MARKATVVIHKTVKFVVALDLDELVQGGSIAEEDVSSDTAIQDFVDDMIYDALTDVESIAIESQSTDHVKIRRYDNE